LVQQCRWGSLAETIDDAVALARKVDRENFGITLEPANLAACGSSFEAIAVQQLAPYLRNVYFQNIRLNADGPVNFPTRTRGDVRVRFVPLSAEGGLEVSGMLAGLKAVDYQGWFTIHQPLLVGQALDAAIEEAARFLRVHGILV
jgi:sugar phosphate isomerase/epimerase